MQAKEDYLQRKNKFDSSSRKVRFSVTCWSGRTELTENHFSGSFAEVTPLFSVALCLRTTSHPETCWLSFTRKGAVSVTSEPLHCTVSHSIPRGLSSSQNTYLPGNTRFNQKLPSGSRSTDPPLDPRGPGSNPHCYRKCFWSAFPIHYTLNRADTAYIEMQ
jgi:hypothetical protein